MVRRADRQVDQVSGYPYGHSEPPSRFETCSTTPWLDYAQPNSLSRTFLNAFKKSGVRSDLPQTEASSP